MNPLIIRWKMVPSYKPVRASFLKFSIVFGAASVQNCTTISPSLVLITATSFEGIIDLFSSARMVAMTSAETIIRRNSVSFIRLILAFNASRSTRLGNWQLCARMKLSMHGFQSLLIDMGINLRCRNVRVTEHFLNDAQIGAIAE